MIRCSTNRDSYQILFLIAVIGILRLSFLNLLDMLMSIDSRCIFLNSFYTIYLSWLPILFGFEFVKISLA